MRHSWRDYDFCPLAGIVNCRPGGCTLGWGSLPLDDLFYGPLFSLKKGLPVFACAGGVGRDLTLSLLGFKHFSSWTCNSPPSSPVVVQSCPPGLQASACHWAPSEPRPIWACHRLQLLAQVSASAVLPSPCHCHCATAWLSHCEINTQYTRSICHLC